MKFFVVTAVIFAIGVLNASADIDPEKCQSGNIIENTLYGFLGTVSQSTTTINTTRDQLNIIMNNVTEQGNQVVTKTFDTFLNTILTTVSNLFHIPVDTLKSNCTDAIGDQEALVQEALNLVASCTNNATTAAGKAIDAVNSEASSLADAIKSAIAKAQSDCTNPSDVVGCVSSVLADIPSLTTQLSKAVIQAGFNVASLDISGIVTSCSSDAVGNVLGNACNSLTELQTCAKKYNEGNSSSN